MSNFIVEDRNTGEIVYAYSAESATEWSEYPFSIYNHNRQKEVAVIAESRTVDKIDWRRLFTAVERSLIDEFNATFEANEYLTDIQKRHVRSGLEDYKASSVVSKDDPSVPGMLALYEALGFIAVGRAGEILA